MAKSHSFALSDLDIRDPQFDRKMLAWAFQVQCEMHELRLVTKEIVADTQIMIAQADRILARG